MRIRTKLDSFHRRRPKEEDRALQIMWATSKPVLSARIGPTKPISIVLGEEKALGNRDYLASKDVLARESVRERGWGKIA